MFYEIYILHINNKRVVVSTSGEFNVNFAIFKLSQTNTIVLQFIKSLTRHDFYLL